MSTFPSDWHTNKRYGYGRRTDGLTLVHYADNHWVLILGAQETKEGLSLLAGLRVYPSLTAALEAVDQQNPPEGWTFEAGCWKAPGWLVEPEPEPDGAGWYVRDALTGKKSSTVCWPASWKARRWCEIRNDRVGMNLRGPKPKGDDDEQE